MNQVKCRCLQQSGMNLCMKGGGGGGVKRETETETRDSDRERRGGGGEMTNEQVDLAPAENELKLYEL